MSPDTAVALRNATFSYDSAAAPLFQDLTLHLSRGFTGVVGANGAGKTTLLQLLCGHLQPQSGSIEGTVQAWYCAQRTDTPPAELGDFLSDWGASASELRSRLGIDSENVMRWHTLSHGERKRLQIGFALWRDPDVLAIDEPTNHIDYQARALLIDALQRFRGTCLIVSHDRALLDTLCSQCVWLEPPTATLYPGNYSSAHEQRIQEQYRSAREHSKLIGEQRQLHRELVRRRERVNRAHAQRSKRGLSAKDSDAREKINRARLTDGKSGASLRQLSGRNRQLDERLAQTQVNKQHHVGLWLPGARAARNPLWLLEAGTVALGPARRLHYPLLHVQRDDRIAISGANGAGKSTLLRHCLQHLTLPKERVLYLPQELSAATASALLTEVRAASKTVLGHVMTIVSRLGSRPERLLSSALPSPGEARKLLLALGMARTPHLIVMDEPTNHLDLPSIEALEQALEDCPCALLLVSHDQRLLERLTQTRWHISVDKEQQSTLQVP